MKNVYVLFRKLITIIKFLCFLLQKFFIRLKLVVEKDLISNNQKGKQQEGYTLEYKVKRRIPLENINEIKMR